MEILHHLILLLLNMLMKNQARVFIFKDTETFGVVDNFDFCKNTKFSIFFKTEHPRGLLVYSEDVYENTFLSVKLIDGSTVNIELKLSSNQEMISKSFPIEINETKWHRIDLTLETHKTRDQNQLHIGLNQKTITSFIIRPVACKDKTKKFLYLGGLPSEMKVDASERLIFTIAFEPGYIGLLNVKMSRNNLGIPLLIVNSSVGLQLSSGDKICSSLEKQVVQLTGKNWIEYKPENEFLESSPNGLESVELYFRTQRSDVFLYEIVYNDIVATQIYVNNGYIEVYQVSSGEILLNKNINCLSHYASCSDREWHSLRIENTLSKIEILVDNQNNLIITKDPTQIFTRIRNIKAGAYPTHSMISNLNGFSGCFGKFLYKNQISSHDILDKLPGYHPENNLKIGQCQLEEVIGQKNNNSICIIRPGGYLRSNLGWKAISKGLIELSLTLPNSYAQRNSILLFMSAIPINDDRILVEYEFDLNSIKSSISIDFLAIEIRMGYLYCSWNFGSGIRQLIDTKTNLANDMRRDISLEITDQSIILRVDDSTTAQISRNPNDYKYLNLNGKLYIGGVPNRLLLNPVNLPRDVLSLFHTAYENSFLGCLHKVTIDGQQVDLGFEASASWAREYTSIDYHETSTFCSLNRCLGQCSGDYFCDCQATNSYGAFCEYDYPEVTVNGNEYVDVLISPIQLQSVNEELDIRFKLFTVNVNQSLFSVGSVDYTRNDLLQIKIINGYISVIYNVNNIIKIFQVTEKLEILKWISLKISRKYNELFIQLSKKIFKYELSLSDARFQYDRISLAGSIQYPEYKNDENLANFLGNITRCLFNGFSITNSLFPKQGNPQKYFHLTRNLRTNINLKLSPNHKEYQIFSDKKYPIIFKHYNSFIRVKDVENTGDILEFEFSVKLSEREGGDKSQGILFLLCIDRKTGKPDCLMSEVSLPNILYSFVPGNDSSRTIKHSQSASLNQDISIKMKIYPDGRLKLNDVKVFTLDSDDYQVIKLTLGNFLHDNTSRGNLNEIIKLNNSFIGLVKYFLMNQSPVNLLAFSSQHSQDLITHNEGDTDRAYTYHKDPNDGVNNLLIDCSTNTFGTRFSCSRNITNQCNCIRTDILCMLDRNDVISLEFQRPQAMQQERITFALRVEDISFGNILSILTQNGDILNLFLEEQNKNKHLVLSMNDNTLRLSSTIKIGKDGLHLVEIQRMDETLSLKVDDEPSIDRKYVTDCIQKMILGSKTFQGSIFGLTYNDLNILEVIQQKVNYLYLNSEVRGQPRFLPLVKHGYIDDYIKKFNPNKLNENNNSPVSDMAASFNNDKPEEMKDDRLIRPEEDCTQMDEAKLAHCNNLNAQGTGLIRPIYQMTNNNRKDENNSNKRTDQSNDNNNNIPVRNHDTNKVSMPSDQSLDETLKDDKYPVGLGDFSDRSLSIGSFFQKALSDINLWLIVTISAGAFLTLILLTLGIYRCHKKHPINQTRAPAETNYPETESLMKPVYQPMLDLNKTPGYRNSGGQLSQFVLVTEQSNNTPVKAFPTTTTTFASYSQEASISPHTSISSGQPLHIILSPQDCLTSGGTLLMNKNQDWFG